MSNDKLPAEHRRINLQAWMDERKLSQTTVAARLGVGRAYVSLLLRTDRAFGEKAARSIEEKLRMAHGFLDSDGSKPEALTNWDRPADLDPGLFGLLPWRELLLDPETHAVQIIARRLPEVALSRESLLEMRVTCKDMLVFSTVAGDALSPYLRHGDIALVDQAQTRVQDGQTYVIRYGSELRFRRLARRFDAGLILRSDHPHPAEEVISAQDAGLIQIVGRVVARWGVL